eukprot:6183759-Alexandrium_andersonii.AAC.1
MPPLARGSDRTSTRSKWESHVAAVDGTCTVVLFSGSLAPARMQRSAQQRVTLLEARGSKQKPRAAIKTCSNGQHQVMPQR